jgi:hypothetical protein
MRLIGVTSLLLLVALYSEAQDYKKNNGTTTHKEDPNKVYQTAGIDSVDVLKALELAGVRIFKIPLRSFDKKYKFSIALTEFIEGKKVGSKNISPTDSNFYFHYVKNDSSKYVQYYDFIEQISFFSKERDTVCDLRIEVYGNAGGAKLRKKQKRTWQNYNWRTYSETSWELNKSIPILVYASSWYDKKFNVERFCGVTDLSTDKEGTAELLNNSPHYYILSYLVSDK